MAVTIIKMTLKEFIKETAAFTKAASKGFGIPTLYINTKSFYWRLLERVLSIPILVDPAPVLLPHLILATQELYNVVPLWNLTPQEKGFAGFVKWSNGRDEQVWTNRITPIVRRNNVKFIFIDDASVLPLFDFLERWSEDLSVTVIIRKD